ncbi:Fe-S cluster assembly protein SufD [candidate division TA06 bacterium]|nr:Fe-S cluster assembly protein SufD [candidate division TA06 bacterium]
MVMTEVKENYLERFEQFRKVVAKNGQGWLCPTRQAAMERFSELGFPTPRDEDWRFTSVAPIARTPFQLPQDGRVELTSQEIEPFTFPGLACSQIVLINGRYSPELSSLRPLPKGVKVASLAQVLMGDRDSLEVHLARYADYQNDAFTALNTAFMDDGVFVHIPKGTVLQDPIHLLYLTTPIGDPTIIHPRNLIVAEEDCEATLVESHASLRDGVYFSNGVTEVVVGENSILTHYMIERESQEAFNVSTLRIEQGRNTNFTSHSVLLGGALVRNNIHPVLAGEGSTLLINCLYMGTGKQHLDNYMKVEHASPHCDSRQLYKGILAGKSRGVFHGRIVVHKDAQKTDAKQSNKNLLLDEGQIDSKPQLEIYADDVKCTHGATTGQLDENGIFYLRSRGIDEESARAILLYAFAGESLQRMEVEPIRKHLESLVSEWISQRKLLENSK